jgi:hypothetical protein
LTVAVLVIFFIVVLALTALFWLLLTGLTTLLALARLARLIVLSGLSALLALSGLTALLALFFHIVCHEYPPSKGVSHPRLENLSTYEALVAARDCKVGQDFFR